VFNGVPVKPYAKGQRLGGMIFNGVNHGEKLTEKPYEQMVQAWFFVISITGDTVYNFMSY
jgi:hypothetical protein